ncbi:MAG: hypothetical protein WB817_16525 [Terriglobales bacterium]
MIEIRDVSAGEIDQLAAFYSNQTGMTEESLRHRLLWLARNPASRPEIPFGVAASQAGRICGAMLFVPTRFASAAAIRICLLSILFYVDASVRGVGVPLFLAYRKLAGKYPLYAATANELSARLWSGFGARAILGSEFEYVKVCRPLPFLSELILSKFVRRQNHHPTEAAQSRPAHYTDQRLLPVTDPEAALQTIPPSPPSAFGLLRDLQMVRWKIYERGQTLYAYRTNRSNVLCLFQRSRRGSRSQIAAVEILEVWGTLDSQDSSNFLSCVKRLFSPDLISFRGGSTLSQQNALVRHFRRRIFACPAVWLMDPSNLLEGRFEYSSLAGE